MIYSGVIPYQVSYNFIVVKETKISTFFALVLKKVGCEWHDTHFWTSRLCTLSNFRLSYCFHFTLKMLPLHTRFPQAPHCSPVIQLHGQFRGCSLQCFWIVLHFTEGVSDLYTALSDITIVDKLLETLLCITWYNSLPLFKLKLKTSWK